MEVSGSDCAGKCRLEQRSWVLFSGRQWCVERPRLRSCTQEEGQRGEMSDKCQVYKLERQALTKAQCLEGWKMPVIPRVFHPTSLLLLLLLQPPILPCKSLLPSSLPSRSLSVSSSLACSSSLSLSLDLISDFPCQLVSWCFLLYFHLALFCRAYQGLLTALAVRYLSTVYLAETFSHHCSGRSQLACLTRPWILWHRPLFAVSFEGSCD